ncbi:unnamed protein product [Paramecium primaurelia]|uniref:Uncharacterized protein n=1 Tax=Paramecium primaurelia TaxID=5886 RepID=A0A8S1L2K9_PARPR|nr:unnamed protein product [Paramecium primaurelia]
MKKEESNEFEQIPFKIGKQSSPQPIGIIKIENEKVWLSFKKNNHFKPDSAILPYQIVKQNYPDLVAERLLYEKLKFVGITQNTENQEQACIFDFNGKECLVKWLPSQLFSWIPVAQADPLNLLDFLETLKVYKIY